MTIQHFNKPGKQATVRPLNGKHSGRNRKAARKHESAGALLLRIGLEANDLDLPTDLSHNHDHYLYGVPKKK